MTADRVQRACKDDHLAEPTIGFGKRVGTCAISSRTYRRELITMIECRSRSRITENLVEVHANTLCRVRMYRLSLQSYKVLTKRDTSEPSLR